jgi:prophage regulatory protein
MLHTLLRLPAVKAQSGYSRSTIYLRMSQGLWTKPVSLGARAVAWPAGDVEALNAARIAGKADEQIRALVLKLESARLGVVGDVATPGQG